MKFYRTFQPFKVISFDLDDTLYDNYEVMRLTEQHFFEDFKQRSGMTELTLAYWREFKQNIANKDPLLAEDVTKWRLVVMQKLMENHQKSAVEIERVSQQSLALFMQWRHKIDVPAKNIQLLEQLKSHYNLVALTNGNVDPLRIGLTQFHLILRGGKDGRCKPHRELFHHVSHHFNVQPNEILHIGDHLTTDVQGAIHAGCQAVWLNLSGKTLADFSEARILPTVEIYQLPDLLKLMAINEN